MRWSIECAERIKKGVKQLPQTKSIWKFMFHNFLKKWNPRYEADKRANEVKFSRLVRSIAILTAWFKRFKPNKMIFPTISPTIKTCAISTYKKMKSIKQSSQSKEKRRWGKWNKEDGEDLYLIEEQTAGCGWEDTAGGRAGGKKKGNGGGERQQWDDCVWYKKAVAEGSETAGFAESTGCSTRRDDGQQSTEPLGTTPDC